MNKSSRLGPRRSVTIAFHSSPSLPYQNTGGIPTASIACQVLYIDAGINMRAAYCATCSSGMEITGHTTPLWMFHIPPPERIFNTFAS
jgi:hypothetical protein